MKDRRARIEMLILCDGEVFFLDLTLAWPKISLCTRKIERKKSKSKSKSARNSISKENPRGGEKVMGEITKDRRADIEIVGHYGWPADLRTLIPAGSGKAAGAV